MIVSILTDLIAPFLKIAFPILSKRRIPKYEGTISLPGLDGHIEIIRDTHGIPHIQAISESDVFFAQGYVHAQDRLFQMELNRRVAHGRVSELFGKIGLETDRLARVLGFTRIGKKDWELFDERSKNIINSYIKGINAFLNQLDNKLPFEFSLIQHKPELWTHEDVLALTRLMIWQMSHGWYAQIIRAQLIEAVGQEHASELEIHYPEGNPSIMKDSAIEFNKLDKKGKMVSATGPFLQKAAGSNSWVIAGSKTSSGKPILCNDMHLPMGLPSLWYQVHLKSKELNVSGVSIPGLPGIIVGHNDKIAWGATLAYTDVEDIFIETFEKDALLTKYKYKGKIIESEIIHEEIYIKDDEMHLETVINTVHGPIISDVLSEKHERFALCSKSLESFNTILPWININYAKDWDEFTTGVKQMHAPQLNLTYADEVNIGFWTTGKVPKRKKGTGMVPMDGSKGDNDWKDDIPFEEMPHALNPKSGIIVNCNNKIITDDYPHYLGTIWMNGYRSRRIEELLTTDELINIDDCKSIQMDVFCQPGVEFVEIFKDANLFDDEQDSLIKSAFGKLTSWDGYLTEDTIGGCLYEVTRYFMIRTMLEPQLGEQLTNIYMGEGINPVILPSHEFYGYDTTVLLRHLRDQGSWWVSHAGGHRKLMQNGFIQACEYMKKKVGSNLEKWTWGRIHRAIFAHPLSEKPPLDKIFNRGNIPVGGDTDTPMQTAIAPQDPFDMKMWAPTVRFLHDLGDLASSETVFAPGESGHLGSKNYDDLVKMWHNGEYFPMYWTRGQIENNQIGKLILES